MIAALLVAWVGLALAAGAPSHPDATKQLRVVGLQVNRHASAVPIIDPAATGGVHFSWRLGCGGSEEADSEAQGSSRCRGHRATGYRVQVNDTAGALLWDSGLQASSTRTWHVMRQHGGGGLLPPDARFRWSVTAAGVTTVGKFQTALRTGDPGDWGGARWIGNFTQARAAFSVRHDSPVLMATAYASGLGCFALTLNGQPANDSMMDPGWSTIPPMRLLYRAYDVSHLLLPGANALGVRLGFCHCE